MRGRVVARVSGQQAAGAIRKQQMQNVVRVGKARTARASPLISREWRGWIGVLGSHPVTSVYWGLVTRDYCIF